MGTKGRAGQSAGTSFLALFASTERLPEPSTASRVAARPIFRNRRQRNPITRKRTVVNERWGRQVAWNEKIVGFRRVISPSSLGLIGRRAAPLLLRGSHRVEKSPENTPSVAKLVATASSIEHLLARSAGTPVSPWKRPCAASLGSPRNAPWLEHRASSRLPARGLCFDSQFESHRAEHSRTRADKIGRNCPRNQTVYYSLNLGGHGQVGVHVRRVSLCS
jgi:hypothetical protein